MTTSFRAVRGLALAFVTAVSAVAAQAQYKPLQFKEYDLANGLHVILHEDHSAPVVSTVLHYRVGSRDEDPRRTGFAHFFEHLMFEATDKIERGSIDKMINGAGGELNAFTSQDQTVYHFDVPSNQVRLALWIEAQRMRKLHVNDIGVETQRGVVKEERKNRYDNAPYGGWMEKMFATLFAGTSYSWAPIGAPEHINNATIAEFKAFYDQYYQPNNAVLVVSGDFDEATVRETIQSYFGGYPKAPEPKRPAVSGLQSMNGEVRETINDAKAQLPAIFIGYRGVGMKEDDAYATELLSTIMSQGESSRLYRAVVDSEQVAVQVSLGNLARDNGGMAYIVGIAGPGKDIGAVEKSIDRELQRVIANGVSDEELSKAKNITEAQFIGQRVGVHDKALALADYYRFYGDTKLINEELAKYLKVTKADIQRVAKRIFDTKNRTVITYLPVKG